MDRTTRISPIAAAVLASAACALALPACHTIHGVGQDVAGTGEVIGGGISTAAEETHDVVFDPNEPLYDER